MRPPHPLMLSKMAWLQNKANKMRWSSGVTLEKVCEYLYYNEKYKDTKDVPDMDIPPDMCLDLLMAADFLNGECSASDY